MNGVNFNCILDTGSSISLINSKCLSLLNVSPREVSPLLVSLPNNGIINLNLGLDLNTCYLNSSVKMFFYAIEYSPFDVLLGFSA